MSPERIRLALRVLPFLVLVGGVAVVYRLHYGDGLGFAERAARAWLGTWDMWATDMVRPYEAPLHRTPEGMVPVDGGEPGYARAAADISLEGAEREAAAAEAWRQYCQHCHGPSGDNRTIVGESFPFVLPDMRSEELQAMEDAELYQRLTHGSERMIPLAGIVSPTERVLALEHVRTLAGAPSEPFFAPRWVEPAEQPGGPEVE